MAGGLGGTERPSRSADAAAMASASPAEPAPSPGASGTADQVGRVIFLQEPAWDGAIVTTRELVVSGMVPAGTGPVRIGLGSASGKALAFRTVDPVSAVDDRPHAFSIELPAGGPRPGGTLTVQVIAYDTHGIPIDVVRRRVVLGPIERTVGGEDGLMGGLTN